MNSQSPVINISGDYEESILRLAKHLGRDKNRRAVFNLIYGRGSKFRSKKEIAEALGKTGNAQVIQNALDELARHHLVVRIENDGRVKDGSRWLYGKDNSVRANRDKILRFADNPADAKNVATKRRPSVNLAVSFVKPRTAKRTSKGTSKKGARPLSRAKLRIALLVTNPERTASLQTGIEARDIDAAIKLGGRSNEVELKVFLAPTFDTLLDALNSYKPDILHFSGHGGGRALLFDNERAGDDGGTILDFDMIARLVAATARKPKLLVLAACDTLDGADRFLQVIPTIVAMSDSIEDEAACAFSARFYRSLSEGATIRNSVDQAKVSLEHKGFTDAMLPQLISVNGHAADHTFL